MIPVLAEIDYANFGIRWVHIVAGVAWIGMLWFFNWVNGPFAKTMDAETKRKVVPELMPRALWWFRWGAAFTWLTGFFMLFLLYYHGDYGYAIDGGGKPEFIEWMGPFAGLFVGFLLYDLMMKTLGKSQELVAMVIWGVLAVGFACVLAEIWNHSQRSSLVHIGALFGTAMAANVWMRIWPAQKRIITAVKNGEAPNGDDVANATMRSRHNTYMSVPLLLLMLSVHDIGQFSANYAYYATAVIAVGWLGCFGCYKMAGNVKGF